MLGEVSAGSALPNCQVYSGLAPRTWMLETSREFADFLRLLCNEQSFVAQLYMAFSPTVLRFAVIRSGAARSGRAHQGHLRPLRKSADWPEPARSPFFLG